MELPNANSCIIWNLSSLTLVFPHHSGKHWWRKWKKEQDFHFSYDHVDLLLQSDLKLLTSPFCYVFSSLGRKSNNKEAKWGEVCLWESTYGDFNSAGVNQPFFQEISQSSGNIPRLSTLTPLFWIKMYREVGI